MADLNSITVIGRLGNDPEIRQAGSADVMSLSIATSRKWKDKNSGEMKEDTQWHRASIWNEHAITFGEKYLNKGDLVLLQGEMQYRKWNDKDGVERIQAEIVFRYEGRLDKLNWEKRDDGDRGGGRDDRGRGGVADRARGGDARGAARGEDRRPPARDSRGGGRDDRDRGGRDGGGDRRPSNDRTSGGRGGSGSVGGGGYGNTDLDDDIPF